AWYLNGQCHRTDGPAVEYANGDKYWCLNDQCHRADGPAIEYANGTKEWWLDGKLVGRLVEGNRKEYYINGVRSLTLLVEQGGQDRGKKKES
ncbi:MAG: hypothetical protein KGH64_06240, partial [Candidatus Micrarchaeota archaeon]|nr:hypothetical protein [Candidatus Micrarchaeota archaeon]